MMTAPKTAFCFAALLLAFVSSLLLAGAQRGDALTLARTNRSNDVDASARGEESAYLSSLNSSRVANGLAPLHRSSILSAGAQVHAGAMGVAGRLFHDTAISSACSKAGAWTGCAENIAMNALGPNSVSVAATDFMNSSEHRGNILNASFNIVGIGVAHVNGNFWIVVRFMSGAENANASTQMSTSPQTRAAKSARPRVAQNVAATSPAVAIPVLAPANMKLCSEITPHIKTVGITFVKPNFTKQLHKQKMLCGSLPMKANEVTHSIRPAQVSLVDPFDDVN
jgi:hypothetical protein